MLNRLHGIFFLTNKSAAATTAGEVVQWFKTVTTNAYIRGVKELGWLRFRRRLWQRNYYEHIVRDEDSLNSIRQYIVDNPARTNG